MLNILKKENIKFPLWFEIINWFVIFSNVFVFGIFALLAPLFVFPHSVASAIFPIHFLAARHIAFGIVMIYGVIKKNPIVLFACYSIFFIIAILDVVLLALYGYYIPFVESIVPGIYFPFNFLLAMVLFLIPMGICLTYITKFIKKK